MAEETPGNIGAMFGGWASGRAAGNKRVDQSVDRVEESLNKFADSLDKMTTRLNGMGTGGSSSSAGSQQAGGKSNGGGATFGGMLPKSAPGEHQADQSFTDKIAQNTGRSGTPNGGAHRGTPDYGGRAKMAGAAAVGGLAVYTANHATNQQIGATIAQQGAGSSDWVGAYKNGLTNNYSAASDADAFQTANNLRLNSGYSMSSSEYNTQRYGIQSSAAVNPSMTQNQVATGTLALQTPGAGNVLAGLGLQAQGKDQSADPRGLARQVLSRMGSSQVKTAEQVAAAFNPSGSATVTLNSMEQSGALPGGSRAVVESEMRNILMAQVNGMSYTDYNKNAIAAGSKDNAGQTGSDARKALADAGIAADTPISKQRVTEGMSRDTEAETVEGFVKELDMSTDALNEFRKALTSLMKIPGVGEATGFASGAVGTVGKLVSSGAGLLGKAVGIGGNAPTMSMGAGGWGGNAPERMSSGGGSHGGGGGGASGMSGGGSAGVGLIQPRPGINAMSSEQDYGVRTIGQGWHTGVDLDGNTGDPIKAAAGGTVVGAGFDGGYGNTVTIDHGGGWTTKYAHMSNITKGKGRKVGPGETIGGVGDTGSYSQGSHLHFELHRNGKEVNPEPYLRGQKLGGATGGGKGSSGPTKGSYGYDGKDRYKSLGAVKPHVEMAAEILGAKFGIKTIGGYRASSAVANSDHPKGLALDFMCTTSQGDSLAKFATANMRGLNITYVIWRQRINSGSGWKAMEDRGSPTANHMDHVHISFMAKPVSNLTGGTPGGGGGGGGKGGDGGGNNMGEGQSYANATGGSGGVGGAYSEVAALGLGGSGGGPGTTGSMGESGGGGGGRAGSRSGGVSGGVGGPGSAGSARIGAYNVLNSTSNAASQRDLNMIMGKVDTLGLGEMIGHKNQLGSFFKKENWGYFKAKGRASDSALAWDKDDYKVLKTGSRALNPNNQGAAGLRNRFAAYALLEDKDSGAKFWQISAHTVPRGTKGGREASIMKTQYANLAKLRAELGKSGIPVVLSGDLNNHDPKIGGFGDTKFAGIDHIMGAGGADVKSKGSIGGLSSDHPFVFANVNLPGGKTGSSVKSNGGSPAQNMTLAQQMLKQRGWGDQWGALKALWMKESGFRTNADNPSSSAYGIPQMLTETHGLGAQYMKDPKTQIAVGLNYIKGRYGDPKGAWNFWQKNNWYDQGAWNLSADHDARVHKGEMILPSKIADVVRDELTAPGIGANLGRSSGNGGVTIKFEKNSINIQLANGSTNEARRAGKAFVDYLSEDRRIKALAEG